MILRKANSQYLMSIKSPISSSTTFTAAILSSTRTNSTTTSNLTTKTTIITTETKSPITSGICLIHLTPKLASTAPVSLFHPKHYFTLILISPDPYFTLSHISLLSNSNFIPSQNKLVMTTFGFEPSKATTISSSGSTSPSGQPVTATFSGTAS